MNLEKAKKFAKKIKRSKNDKLLLIQDILKTSSLDIDTYSELLSLTHKGGEI